MAPPSGPHSAPGTHRAVSEGDQPPRSEPEDIFFQTDQELKFVEEELASFARCNPDQRERPFPQRHIEALLQLKQFSPIFRHVYKELLSRLPISISVRSRNAEFGVPMTSLVDMPSTHYARFRCVYADSVNTSSQCETWTLKPYVIDTYLPGLSSVLGAAADAQLEGNELEAHLAAGYKLMCCSEHADKMKDEQASAFAVVSRRVVEKWREDLQLWWCVGKLEATPIESIKEGTQP